MDLLLLLALALSAPAAPAAEWGGPVGVRPDTVLVRDFWRERLLDPPPLTGGAARPVATLGLAVRPVVVEGGPWPSADPVADRLPWLVERSAPRLDGGVREPERADGFTRQATREFLRARAAAGAAAPDPLAFLHAEEGGGPGRSPPAPFDSLTAAGLVSRYAELGLRVRGRSEIGGDWTRFRPCTSQFQESCVPSLLPQLSPDINLAVELQGSVMDRVSVEVDYDQLREFGETNTISVVYDGNEDDILRRLEVGDVTFRLPQSRYLTRGIPAGNFGFQAEGQLGPLDFSGVWAQQRGDLSSREFRLTGVGNQRRFVQEDTLVLDDADYVTGQFFFVFDPAEISGYPHIDVLDLDAGAAPASVVPGPEPIQLYRFENDPGARQQVEGWIQADAVAEGEGGRVEESGWFRYLQPGLDYVVHPSGSWVVLRSPLSRDEMLAVTYVTAVGDTVGTYDPERVYNSGGRPQLRLLKASGANHQPGRPTWELEMHQVYRVSTNPDVEPTSVDVTISLGEPSAGRTFRRAADGRDITFLQLTGLDRDSPLDRIDPGVVYSPSSDLLLGTGAVQGSFVVFPTLRPFFEPPPLPNLDLTAEEARELLGEDANARIYTAEDRYEREAGGLFRLTIPFRIRSEGVISSFSLGAIGILPGSERILVGERPLVQGVDYQIDYDLGQVTLLDPEALFAAVPDAPVRATWEQQQVFRAAPTSVFGFNGRLGDPRGGQLNLLALYRTEKTLVNRPTLGLEPGAALLGGVSGVLERGLPWLDGWLAGVPGLRTASASAFSLDGEAALSLPDPNTRGDVFLDDFDASDERPLSLQAQEWQRGSAPTDRDGAADALPGMVDASTLARAVWQHRWIVESPQGDSLGVFEGFLPREEIDQQIRVAGSRVRETGMAIRFQPQPGAADRSWASITTVLSPTGSDLTQSEFIEFYARDGEALTLVIDLGLVSEDALFVDDQGRTAGTKENGTPWGLGILDQEADPSRAEIWGDLADARGVWGETCIGERGRIFRLGDPRAVCTRSNGRNDTEDLDGDGNLDVAERSLRWVVRLDGASPYRVRTREETGTRFRLFRVPISVAEATQVNGPITDGDLRSVKHLRLTVTGDRPETVTLARMRIVGSRWLKRAVDGVVTGIVGDTAAIAGRVDVSPVSAVTEGDAYVSPPGVLEQLSDPTSAVGGSGVEFNEKSLRIGVDALMPGDRAEVYSRFPQAPRNFLNYGEARLWVLPREGDWGLDEPVSFFVKFGTDPENFYVYRTPLRPAVTGQVTRTDWSPEVVVDFGVFQELRTRAEEILALVPPSPGDPPLTLWARDSTYAVVVRDRGRAPNLAAVRELSMGIWNQGDTPFEGEVWVDELRLSRGVTEAGLAGVLNATLDVGDLVQTRVGYSSRGAFFRQLEEDATYQTDDRLTVTSTARLERFMPASWGVEMPVSVELDRSRSDPTYLSGSDVRADRLPSLRETGADRTRVGVGFRKITPSTRPLLGLFVDGLEANLGWYRTSNSSVTSRLDAEGVDARVGVERRLEPREFDPVPDFAEPLVRFLLPGALEEAVLGARIRWAPERISLGASYVRQDASIRRFDRILERPEDSAAAVASAPRELMETVAEVGLRPVPSLTADLTFFSTRDLLDPAEAATDPRVQALLAAERGRVGGVDVGWETRRSLRSRVSYRPRIVPWLRHEVTWTSRYDGERSASFVEVIPQPGDSLLLLQRNALGERDLSGLLSFDPRELVRGEDARSWWQEALFVFQPITLTARDGLFSRFDRDPISPGAGYQFGWTDRDGYLALDGDSAATVVDRHVRQVAWGWMAGPVELDAVWGETETATLDSRADRTVRTRTWPDLSARVQLTSAPTGSTRRLQSAVLGTGVRVEERELQYGGAGQRRLLDETVFPWDVSVRWLGGVTTAYRGTLETGVGEDPTGDTERDRVQHTVSFASTFIPPFGLGARAVGDPVPVRLSVLLGYVAERECRVPRNRADCVPFLDQLNRSLSFSLDTRVSDFEVGIQGSYFDRQSFVGERRGSTQFQLSVFGQFLIEAGALGRLGPG